MVNQDTDTKALDIWIFLSDQEKTAIIEKCYGQTQIELADIYDFLMNQIAS